MFSNLRKIHYDIMSREWWDTNEADILADLPNQFRIAIILYMNWIELQMHMLTFGKSWV